jgi:glycosyltransferase involved in cell wall biosynthesis
MIVFNQYPLGETRVQRQAEALIRAGYNVDVICKREYGESAIDTYKGVRIFREKFHLGFPFIHDSGLWQKFIDYLYFFISAFVRLNRLHLVDPYSSIQVHNLPDFLVFCTLIQRLKKVPIILDLHDLMPEFYFGRFRNHQSLIPRLIRWQERKACRFADHVLTVSEHWRYLLIQRGLPEKKCSVVMNVADLAIFHPRAGQPPQSPDGVGFQLIYHGTMVRRYGIDLVIEAVDQLKDQIPGIHLHLIGQGEYLPTLSEMVDVRNLKRYVSFEPKMQAEELPEIILSCDLGIVPYRNDVFTDGLLPTKLMEYAALGLPAVASRTSAIERYFAGTNTELFEPENVDDLARCVLKLYHHPARLSELRQGCQKFNERYNWNNISAQYVNLVQHLVNKDNFSSLHSESTQLGKTLD